MVRRIKAVLPPPLRLSVILPEPKLAVLEAVGGANIPEPAGVVVVATALPAVNVKIPLPLFVVVATPEEAGGAVLNEKDAGAGAAEPEGAPLPKENGFLAPMSLSASEKRGTHLITRALHYKVSLLYSSGPLVLHHNIRQFGLEAVGSKNLRVGTFVCRRKGERPAGRSSPSSVTVSHAGWDQLNPVVWGWTKLGGSHPVHIGTHTDHCDCIKRSKT